MISTLPIVENPPRESSLRALVVQSTAQCERLIRGWMTNAAATIQAMIYPTLTLLMFYIVLGKSVDDYSMFTGQRGIFGFVPMLTVVAVMSGSTIGAMHFKNDQVDGFVSRFATLPVHRAADLVGRLMAETVRNFASVLLIVGVGLVLGFRFERGFGDALLFLVIPLLWGVAFSTFVTAIATYSTGGPILSIVAVLTTALMFFNTGFVPLMAYPEWTQPFVANQPMSCVIDVMRALSDSNYLHDPAVPLMKAAAWSLGIIAVCSVPAVRGYRRVAAL